MQFCALMPVKRPRSFCFSRTAKTPSIAVKRLSLCIVDSATQTLLTATRMVVSAQPLSASSLLLTRLLGGNMSFRNERISTTDQ